MDAPIDYPLAYIIHIFLTHFPLFQCNPQASRVPLSRNVTRRPPVSTRRVEEYRMEEQYPPRA